MISTTWPSTVAGPWKPRGLRIDRFLLLAILLCLCVRLGFLAFSAPDYRRLPLDVDRYGELAANLAAGRGFRMSADGPLTAARPPLYPLFLAGLRLVGLGAVEFALVAQAILDGLTCLVLYLLTLEISRGEVGDTRRELDRGEGRVVAGQHASFWAPRLAALAWALYLPAASLMTRLWSEPLATLVTTAGLWALARAWRTPRRGWFFLAGVMLGITVLVRATALAGGLVLALIMFFRHRAIPDVRARVLLSAILLAGITLPLFPWLLRNGILFKTLIPTTTHGGHTAYGGNCAIDGQDYLRIVHGPEVRAKLTQTLAARGIATTGFTEVDWDRAYRQELWRLVRRFPGRFLRLSLVRFCRLWLNLGFVEQSPSAATVGVALANSLLLMATLAGLVLRRGTWLTPATPIFVFLMVTTGQHMATVAYVRYAIPLVPALLAIAATAWFRTVVRSTGSSAASGTT